MTTWHVADGDLRAYVDRVSAPPATASVEAHLLGCAHCRARLAPLVDPVPLERTWQALSTELLVEPPSRVERAGVRLGLSPRDALLVAAAPALRSAWVIGVLLSVLAAVAVANDRALASSFLFLVVAPLVPVGAVALAYSRELDPLWETTAATPYPRLRLVLLRALAVVVTALPLVVLGGPLLPGPAWAAAAWLLPAAACVVTTLALATWTDVTRAALVVTTAWVSTVAVVAGPGLDRAAVVLSAPLLLLYLLAAAAAGVVLWLRNDTFSYLGRPS